MKSGYSFSFCFFLGGGGVVRGGGRGRNRRLFLLACSQLGMNRIYIFLGNNFFSSIRLSRDFFYLLHMFLFAIFFCVSSCVVILFSVISQQTPISPTRLLHNVMICSFQPSFAVTALRDSLWRDLLVRSPVARVTDKYLCIHRCSVVTWLQSVLLYLIAHNIAVKLGLKTFYQYCFCLF